MATKFDPRALALLAAPLLLAGCSGLLGPFAGPYQFKKDSAAMGCPPKAVERIADTRARLGLIEPGVATAKDLRFLGAPTRTMVLARAGQEDLNVAFYPLGLETCRWVADSYNTLPVVFRQGKHGVVLGHGVDTLQTLHAQGWELGTRTMARRGWGFGSNMMAGTFTPTPWPWQSYNYSYLPRR